MEPSQQNNGASHQQLGDSRTFSLKPFQLMTCWADYSHT